MGAEVKYLIQWVIFRMFVLKEKNEFLVKGEGYALVSPLNPLDHSANHW